MIVTGTSGADQNWYCLVSFFLRMRSYHFFLHLRFLLMQFDQDFATNSHTIIDVPNQQTFMQRKATCFRKISAEIGV